MLVYLSLPGVQTVPCKVYRLLFYITTSRWSMSTSKPPGSVLLKVVRGQRTFSGNLFAL